MMQREKINLGTVLRIGISLLPILFGLPTLAVVFCAYSIGMSFLMCGPMTGIVSSLCAICISMFFCKGYGESAQLQGLFIGLEAVLCALGSAYTLIRKKSFFEGVWMTSLGFLIPSFISILQLANKAGESIAGYLTKEPVMLLKEQFSVMFEQAGLNNDILNSLIEAVSNITIMIIPSVIILSSIVIGYIIMWLVYFPFRKISDTPKHSFAQICMPKTATVVMLVSFALWLVFAKEEISYIPINIFFILAGLSFFHGMSLVDFFMRKRIKGLIIRILIHFLVFINIFAVYIFISIIDSFVNIRKLYNRKTENIEGSEKGAPVNESKE